MQIWSGDELVTEITPADAANLLSTIKNNRRLNDVVVNKYLRDISSGRWNPYSIIKIADTGELNDGQHRLTACVKAGTPIQAIVVRVPREDILTTDIGTKRTPGQMLKIVYPDLRDVNHMASMIGLCLRYNHEAKDVYNTDVSVSDIVDTYGNDRTYWDALVTLSKGVAIPLRRNGIKASSPTVVGFAYHQIVLEGADPEEVAAFFTEWREGQYTPASVFGALDRALRALGDGLGANVAFFGMRRRASALIIKAWNMWISGETKQVISFRAGGSRPEPYPVPLVGAS